MINLTQEKIKQLAKNSNGDHIDYVINLYMLIPGFKECKSTTGNPIVSHKTALFILDTFHNMYPKKDNWDLNGLWLNRGFSWDVDKLKNIPDWKIDTSEFKLYKDEKVQMH
jgi:hypothetical protein